MRSAKIEATSARLTAQWVALGGLDDEAQLASAAAAAATPVTLPAGFAPGSIVNADLKLYAPTVVGDYLLVLDILSPEQGSLTALGVEPTIIRVRVVEPTATGADAAAQQTLTAPTPSDAAATAPSAAPASTAPSTAPSAAPAQ